MKSFFTILAGVLLASTFAAAQNPKPYTTAQAHSHNDYTRARPFYEAYGQQFGSIEADLHWVDGKLYVAHDAKEISPKNTFEVLYLEPIINAVKKNDGHIYPQPDAPLQLLIDLKTAGEPTLGALVEALAPHEDYLAPKGPVHIVISGNVPAPALFANYPAYISFDGRPEITYTPEQLARVGLISQAFQKYSKWNGEGHLPEKDKKHIEQVIRHVHGQGKKIRLWATPDNVHSWRTMMHLGVDYLNTDKVKEMGDYLRTAPR